MSRILRKRFCEHYSQKINKLIRKYFQVYKWADMVEPRDIKGEFFEICKLLKKAKGTLEMLQLGAPQMAKKVVNYRMQAANSTPGASGTPQMGSG